VPTSDLDRLAVATLRTLSIDTVQRANSGHPGLPLGAAPMAFALWHRVMRHNPADPRWADRDRFVLSAGHGSALLYALLHLFGYDLSLDDLRRFRQAGSRTPGHPEAHLTPGVELTTGPLGQGFANGVGMAMAEAHLAATYNRPGHTIVDHYTYGIVSDGDLMEGVAYEAASLVGKLALGKLIYLYDQNDITLAGSANLSFAEDIRGRFASVGWHVAEVEDGNDLDAIEQALQAARQETARPSLIAIHTTLGFGSPHKGGTFEAHGSPLGPDEVAATKKNLGWSFDEPFTVPEEASRHAHTAGARGADLQRAWTSRYAAYRAATPDLAAQFERTQRGSLPESWDTGLPTFAPTDPATATRSVGGRVMNAISGVLPELFGGSADLNPSTNTALAGKGDFQAPGARPGDVHGAVGGPWGPDGRNVHFGVREHAMGSIANGIAYHGGLIPYTATFFCFSDYMKPAIRLAALSDLGVIFVFTHDSVGLGEDGPTHQPVEHLAALRALPDVVVYRPADGAETTEGWRIALERRHAPTVLVHSRQNLPHLDRAAGRPASEARRGGYILADAEGGNPRVILIATGSEVALAVAARQLLIGEGTPTRVVSLPSWELFAAQDAAYRESVLPRAVRARVAIEAGSSLGWHRWVGEDGAIVAVDRFGLSAPLKDVLISLGLTPEAIAERARALLR